MADTPFTLRGERKRNRSALNSPENALALASRNQGRARQRHKRMSPGCVRRHSQFATVANWLVLEVHPPFFNAFHVIIEEFGFVSPNGCALSLLAAFSLY